MSEDSPVPTAAAVLEYIAKAVVDEPDALRIEVDTDQDPIRLNVFSAPDDMGRLIGRRGRVANSIRTVVRAAAHGDGHKVDIEFIE